MILAFTCYQIVTSMTLGVTISILMAMMNLEVIIMIRIIMSQDLNMRMNIMEDMKMGKKKMKKKKEMMEKN